MTPEQVQELRELAFGLDENYPYQPVGRNLIPHRAAAALRACAEREERALAVADAVPTTWLNPLLTGSKAVIGKGPYTGTDIENLLRAVKARVQSAALALRPDAKELEHLRAFAKDIMRSWPEGGVDGGELQDAALRHGLLEPAEPTQEERDEWGLCDTDDFYRRTALLTDDLSRATGDGNGR